MWMLVACNEDADPAKDYIYFPIGRAFTATTQLSATINGRALPFDTLADKGDGYWLRVSRATLPANGTIVLQFTRRGGNVELFKGTVADQSKWLSEASYIDCNKELFKTKAAEITQGATTRVEKAKLIQKFVANHVRFQVYKDSFLEEASKTYELGYGTCMNFSRLFVSLCRSIGIPARSVWGVVYGYNNDNIYDYHHQWAELLDESGLWHTTDFSYTRNFDKNDLRYLDLLYAAEENSFIGEHEKSELQLGNVSYFNNYPASLTGKLGFELVEDARPDHMTLKFSFTF